MRRAAAGALVLALACGAVGCAATAPPVALTDAWPAKAGDYDEVSRAWTRSATMRGTYQQALEVHATFRSPEWRAAHAAREARIRRVEGAARDELFAAARAAAAGDHEVVLVVTTYDRSENDLHRGDRSVWRLALVDDAGIETAPLKVERDRRPAEILRAELPTVGDFAQVYIARFPRSAAVLRPDARRMQLKMWSAKGGVTLTWAAR